MISGMRAYKRGTFRFKDMNEQVDIVTHFYIL